MSAVAVYKIENTITGKLYIGQSINPEKRYARHFWKNSGCIKLRNSIQKYGKLAFNMDIIHWCADRKEANELEVFLILECNTISNGYNITPGGNGTGAGKDNPFYGKTHTEEVKKLLSENAKYRTPSIETRLKMAAASGARVWTEASKDKLRNRPKSEFCSLKTAEANTNRIWTNESKEKLRVANLGKKASDKTKAKISLANSVRVWTEASKIKISEAAKARHKRNKEFKMGTVT